MVLLLARCSARLFALLGAGAVLGATTQGPISAVVLMMELTGRDRPFILPLLLIVGIATLVARTIELRSISNDARLTDEEVRERRGVRGGYPSNVTYLGALSRRSDPATAPLALKPLQPIKISIPKASYRHTAAVVQEIPNGAKCGQVPKWSGSESTPGRAI